jgi:hypothetical protein
MYRYVLAVSFVFSMSAYADGIPASKQQECGQKAWLASMAATARDGGVSPQGALKIVTNNHPYPLVLSDKYMKDAINSVYFDDRLHGIPPEVLYNQVIQTCIGPTFQPLR